MAALKLTSVSVSKEQDSNLKQNYLYKDVLLDLTIDVYRNPVLNKAVPIKDVQAIYDTQAVKTSISNCFLTSPGQRVLSPRYGIDLRRYLFEEINEDTAYFIKEDIENNLPRFEPRIIVENVSISADTDNQQYNIILKISIPSLNLTGITVRETLIRHIGYY